MFRHINEAFVWPKMLEPFIPKNPFPTIKHGGGGIMLWAYSAAFGTGNSVWGHGVMNKEDYVDMLKYNVKKSSASLTLSHLWVLNEDKETK